MRPMINLNFHLLTIAFQVFTIIIELIFYIQTFI